MALFDAGSRFFFSIERQSAADVFIKSRENPQRNVNDLHGDVSFRVEPAVGGAASSLLLEHLGLVSRGVRLPNGSTGAISITGIEGEAPLKSNAGSWRLEMPITALVLYEAVERGLPIKRVHDRRVPSFEIFSGILDGQLSRRNVNTEREELFLVDGSLDLRYVEGGLGMIRSVKIPIRALPVAKLRISSESSGSRFLLKVRPVGFKSSADDDSPSGVRHVDQLANATAIWKECGILLDVQAIHHEINNDLKKGQQVEDMRLGWTDPDLRTIEIYFSANDMPDGGGQAVSCGAASAAIAVTDNDQDLPNLVAHEIGHVLGGIHPTDKLSAGEWNGDPHSVLEPPGGLLQPKPLNSKNCQKAVNAALQIIK